MFGTAHKEGGYAVVTDGGTNTLLGVLTLI